VPPSLGQESQKSTISPRYVQDRNPYKDNPGPGQYSVSPRFAVDATKFTLKGRPAIKDREGSPGPAAYSPEWLAGRVRAPVHSVHVRPHVPPLEIMPGPGQYTISRDLEGLKATLHGRPPDPSGAVTPGPSDYVPGESHLESPARFTIKNRREVKEHPNTAPYRVLASMVGEGPKISLSSRHREPKGPVAPGPTYVPPNFGEDDQKNSIGYRGPGPKDPHLGEPGPGAYNTCGNLAEEPTKITIAPRYGRERPNTNPAPDQYDPDWQKTRRAPTMPAIRVKPPDGKLESRPGYVLLQSTLGGPAYTMKGGDNLDGMLG
jgi:hypothetical protein